MLKSCRRAAQADTMSRYLVVVYAWNQPTQSWRILKHFRGPHARRHSWKFIAMWQQIWRRVHTRRVRVCAITYRVR
jgi:hypothetical protein